MKRALIGAGGSAREIKAHMGDLTMKMFVDDEYWRGNDEDILPLSTFDPKEYEVLITIGNPKDKFDLRLRLPENTKYFTYIHPSAQILGILGKDVCIGKGVFIGANCILTCDLEIGDHVLLNRGVQVGHDCFIDSYCSIMPGCIISGNCEIADSVYIGTNTAIREKIKIHSLVTIGMGSTVIENITESGTYVGTPIRKIK